MTFYTDMQDTALSLIERFGQDVTFTRESGETVDPYTDERTPGTSTDYVAKGIVKDIGVERIEGTVIEMGDKLVTIAAKDFAIVPELTDKVSVNGQGFSIKHVMEANPAGTHLVYKVLVREL